MNDLKEYNSIINSLNILLDHKNIEPRIIKAIYNEENLNIKIRELEILVKILDKEEIDFKKNMGIKDICFGEKFNYIVTSRDKYVTYIKLEINEILDLVGEDIQLNYIRNFYSLLDIASDNLSIYYIDKDINFDKNIQNVLRQLESPQNQNEEFQLALKSDLNKYLDLKQDIKYEKQMIMMVESNDLVNLTILLKQLKKNTGNNILMKIPNDNDFRYILNKLVYSNKYLQESSSGTYGYDKQTEEYVQIIQVKEFEKMQNLLYLQNLVNARHQIEGINDFHLICNVNKLSKSKSVSMASKTLQKVNHQHKFDKTISGHAEQRETWNDVSKISEELKNNKREVITKVEFKIVVRAKTLEGLNEFSEMLKNLTNGSITFIIQPFVLKELLIKNVMFKNVKLTDTIELTLTTLAASFGYNYIQFQEPEGMLLCATKTSIVTTNIFYKNNLTQLSCGFIFGTSGSGKSTLIKYLITHNYLQSNKTFIVDQDNEFGVLTNALGGTNIFFGDEKTSINPLKIDVYNESQTLNERIRIQYNIMVQIMKSFYPEEYVGDIKVLFEASLNELYKKHQANEFIISDIIKYNQKLIDNKKSKDNKMFEKSYRMLNMMLNNLITTYPMFNRKTNVELTGKTINFNITNYKNDLPALNSLMIIILQFLNSEMAKNRIYKAGKNKEEIKEHLIERITSQLNLNYTIEELNELDNGELEKLYNANKNYILTIIDEAHRMFSNDQVIDFLDKSARESRKYDAGIFFASQSFNDVFREDLKTISALWELLPYKFMLKQEKKAVENVAETINLTTRQQQQITSAVKGTGLVQIGDRNFPYHNVISEEYLNIFGGGN